MSNTIRGRRITEPVLVQRGPSPFERYDELWQQVGEAKSVLRRAERRLDDADVHRVEPYSPRSQEPNQYVNSEHTVNIDRVPSVELGITSNYKIPDHRGQHTNSRTPRKKVTIKDGSEVTETEMSTKDSRLTSGYRSHSDELTTRHTVNDERFNTHRYHDLDDFELAEKGRYESAEKGRYESAEKERYESAEKGRFAKFDSGFVNKEDDTKHGGYNAYNEYDAKTYSSPRYDERSTSAIDTTTQIRVLNDVPTYRAGMPQQDYTSAYRRLYGAEQGLDNDEQTVNDTRSSRFNAEGLSKVRDQIEKQRKLANKDESVDRVRHHDSDAVNFIPAAAHYEPKNTTVLTSRQPKVRKVAAAPPAPTYKGFNEVETKIMTPDGKVYKEGEMKRKTRTRNITKTDRSVQDRALQPHRASTSQDNKPSMRDTMDDKRRITRKMQRVSAPKDKKPHRIDRQGIITARSWREGQKVTLKVLGPPPPKKKPVRDVKPIIESDDDDDVVMKVATIKEKHDERKASDEEELSQHTIESIDKPTNTNALSEQAKDVLGDLHLDKSESEHSEDEDKDRRILGSKVTSKPTMKSKKRTGSASKRKHIKNNKEPLLPAQKIRHYDSDDVRKFMLKQQADRKKKKVPTATLR